MLNRTLVPLDGSETAESILLHVRRLLIRHEGEVLLLEVESPLPSDLHFAIPRPRKDIEQYLQRIASRLASEGIRARGLHAAGRPAEVILETVLRDNASLVAMTTHGRSGLSRWVFGSVAEKVVRASPVPVLVSRSFQEKGVRERPLQNILVPLDGSSLSLEILPHVKQFARPVDACVTLLHVVEDSPLSGKWGPPERTHEEAERELRAACVRTAVRVRKGDPATEILNACAEENTGLIAMSTHGRSGPSRWAFGSVTEKVLRAGTVPMLVARKHPVDPAHPGPVLVGKIREVLA